MKKLFILLPLFLFFSISVFSQETNPYNIPKQSLKQPLKVQELMDRIHFALQSGKLKCYQNNLKEPYHKAEIYVLGSKSMTVEYHPNPLKEPNKVELRDTTILFQTKNITGYGVNYYKVKVPVIQDDKNQETTNNKSSNAEKKKEKLKNNDKKGNVKEGKAKNEKEIQMKEENRPAFAPYIEVGEYVYWLRFEDLPTILTEQEIGLLKKELLRI